MENLDSAEKDTNPEITSKKTLKMWLPKKPPYRSGGYIGEIYIDNNQFVAEGETEDDTVFLNRRIEHLWYPQLGIPVWKKKGDEFVKDSNGRFILEKYVNQGNSSPDELLEAIYNYTLSMRSFRVELVDR